MVCAFFSCSDNDEPVNLSITPVVPDATLSLAVQTDGRVKTKGGFIEDGTKVNDVAWDFQVKNLTLVIFNNDGNGANTQSGVPVGTIASVVTQPYSGTAITAAPIVEKADVVSGDAHLLLLANLPQSVIDQLTASGNSLNPSERKTIEQVLQMTTDLGIENSTNGLTMSSELIPVTIGTGINYVGFGEKNAIINIGQANEGTEIYGPKPVDLIRRVAAIELEKIELPTVTGEIYQSVKFEPKEVFVANVKSTAGIGSAAGVTIEQTAEAANYYLAPAKYISAEGSLKHGTSTADNNLLKDMTGTLNVTETMNITLPPCYVYPNQEGEAAFAATTEIPNPKNYTLLVVKGDYTYRLINDPTNTPVKEENRYYAVIVNDNSLGGTFTGEGEYNVRVKRNTKYSVTLQVLGTGSDKPFTPAAFAHVAAKVEVANWSVINIEQPVD